MSSDENRLRRRVRFALVAFGPLAAVLIAVAVGASSNRLRPIAGFLAVAAGSGAAAFTTARAKRRRAFRLKRSPIPRGVRFSKPWWLYTDGADLIVHYAALMGALLAVFRQPGVGVGILLVAVVGLCFMPFFGFGPRGLTFETSGLRLHYRQVEVLVPWNEIRDCEQVGPDHMAAIQFRLASPERVGDWVTPDTPSGRSRAQNQLAPAGNVLWLHWTAGLDAQTLLRAIHEGIEGRSEQMN